MTFDRYNLKWKLLNDMDLFFVVVYQGILQMAYLEAGLDGSSGPSQIDWPNVWTENMENHLENQSVVTW